MDFMNKLVGAVCVVLMLVQLSREVGLGFSLLPAANVARLTPK